MEESTNVAPRRASWLPPAHRQFLIGDHGVGPTVVNAILNGGIGWLVFRGHDHVVLRGSAEVPVELVITAFLIPFATAMVASAMVASQVRRGKVPPLDAVDQPAEGWSFRPRWQRGLFLAAIAIVVFALPAIAWLQLWGPDDVPLWTFVKWKAGFGAAVAAFASPPVGWWALADASRGAPAGAGPS